MFPWAYYAKCKFSNVKNQNGKSAFCFLCTQRFGTFTFSPSRGQAGCSPRRHAARQTRPVHRPPAQAHQHHPCDTDQGASKIIASAAADVEAAPRSRCPPTRAPAPPRSPPQAAGPPQEHERAQLSGASVEVLRCMRTGPLPPAVGAPGANLSGAEEALIFFGPALACTG